MGTKRISLTTQKSVASGPFTILNDHQTAFDNTNRLSRISRRHHRDRDVSKIPVCRGCVGG